MKHIRLEVPVGEHEGNADGGYKREKTRGDFAGAIDDKVQGSRVSSTLCSLGLKN